MKDFKSIVPALVIIALLYLFAGTADFASLREMEQARAGVKK